MKALSIAIALLFFAHAEANPLRIEFAYRDDTTVDDNRTFQLQGEREETSLVETCGTSGAKCFCEFYSASKLALSTSVVTHISADLNQAFCDMNGDADVDEVAFVRIRRAGNTRKYSRLVPVKTHLDFNEVFSNRLNARILPKTFR